MTKEEAISRLKKGAPFSEVYDPVWDEALKMAIEAIKQKPFKPMVEIDLYSVIKQKYIEREVLDKIRADIESNMESVTGKYDSSIPKFNMPSYKIERNKVRKECISIIDKYKAESEDKK